MPQFISYLNVHSDTSRHTSLFLNERLSVVLLVLLR